MAKNLKPSAVAAEISVNLPSSVDPEAASFGEFGVTVGPTAEMAAIPEGTKLPKVANQAITMLVTINPKRGKSAPRFELYRTSPDTHSYIQSGGYSADLAWDVKRGFIKLG